MSEKLKVGDIVNCKVTSLTPFGAFVETDEDVLCLLHVRDLSWSRSVTNPAKVLRIGQKLRCKVTVIDIINCRIQVSLKDMQQDPWIVAGDRFPVGKTIAAPISRLLDRGVIVTIAEGLEGYVPLAKLPVQGLRVPADAFRVGQLLTGRITAKDPETQKITISCIPAADEYQHSMRFNKAVA